MEKKEEPNFPRQEIPISFERCDKTFFKKAFHSLSHSLFAVRGGENKLEKDEMRRNILILLTYET